MTILFQMKAGKIELLLKLYILRQFLRLSGIRNRSGVRFLFRSITQQLITVAVADDYIIMCLVSVLQLNLFMQDLLW